MIRIGAEDDTTELRETSITEQDKLEENLREWIIDNAESILGEDVLLIGREVTVKDIRDGIDLLAIDRDGNVVIIELKQGRLRGTVDFQALKYAAYTSHWSYEQLRDQFNKFKSTSWGQSLYDEETSFNDALEAFCNEEYTPNDDQRIILVGESLETRLELVSRWLSDKEVDITVVEIQLLEDDGRLYLDAEQTVPIPSQVDPEVKPDTSDEPWKDNGRNWHLNEVTNEETSELLEEVVASLSDIELVEGPHWGQKQYVSFKQGRKNRILVLTQKTLFKVELYDIDGGDVDIEGLANALEIPVDDVSADAENIRDGRPGVQISCRPGQALNVSALGEQMRDLLAADAN